VTGAWTLRAYRHGDDDALVALWNATLVRDPISPARFRRQTLLHPGFRPEGCLLAELGGEPAGFALALAPGTPPPPAGAARAVSGRLVGLGVLPRARRQGLGASLLDASLTFLRDRGCARVGVAAHEYYAAGVDADAYADGIAFLERRGFGRVGEAVAMGRDLYDLSWPDQARAAEARLRTEGIEVRSFDPLSTFALVEYFRAEFPDWVEFFVRKLDAGHERDEIVVATHGDRVVGYCQHLDADHVGPFGVAAAYRDRGIGTVMLYRLLDAMRQKGYRFAWFGETGRARPYYERAGFRLTRSYVLLRRDLVES
jgi:GNAT superfamily N-acetyltransferase